MQKITNREKIFQLVNSRRFTTAREIANYFKMPVPTVRFHLRELVRQGRIFSNSAERVHHLGKPRLLYTTRRLSNESLFRNLLDEVLNAAEANVEMKKSLIKLASIKIAQIPGAGNSSLTLKMIELIDNLNQNGYNSRWEVHKNSPRVIIEECPYRLSQCRDTFFCEMDKYMIEQWTNQSVKFRKFDDEQGKPACQFEISS